MSLANCFQPNMSQWLLAVHIYETNMRVDLTSCSNHWQEKAKMLDYSFNDKL